MGSAAAVAASVVPITMGAPRRMGRSYVPLPSAESSASSRPPAGCRSGHTVQPAPWMRSACSPPAVPLARAGVCGARRRAGVCMGNQSFQAESPSSPWCARPSGPRSRRSTRTRFESVAQAARARRRGARARDARRVRRGHPGSPGDHGRQGRPVRPAAGSRRPGPVQRPGCASSSTRERKSAGRIPTSATTTAQADR